MHAQCTAADREELWASLLRDNPKSGAWLVDGDYNAITDAYEKREGCLFNPSEAIDFVQFLGEANLIHTWFFGASFTWCNNQHSSTRIWKQLDMVLVNKGCHDTGLNLSLSHLTREPSNHAPLLISVATRLDNKLRPF